MALATSLLQGQQSEWALVRRHSSERLFGVQVCGSHADSMTRCAQMLCETSSIDFIDINVGCPIDLICQKGAGCALMTRQNRLQAIISGMRGVMGEKPLTIKIRTGYDEGKNTAHILGPKLSEWGVSLFTLHGRSREARYTKLADWDYAAQVARVSKPLPVFACGDVLSFEEYYSHLESRSPEVIGSGSAGIMESGSPFAGVMLARGALIKPWLLTEIKERRHWDIQAGERLEILRKYVNYGLDHWGSDQAGIDRTRRFLLEWLSFLHRYIPVGILERLPQKINERPPYFRGRNELETLMASGNCADWIRISEMLLGPVADDFKFLPKHKANSYQ